MTPEEREIITDLKLCNFKQMHTYFVSKNEERKNMTKEEKQVRRSFYLIYSNTFRWTYS